MSVSDDSKMKIIETKYQIINSFFKQIQDKEFQKYLSLIELKVRDQNIYQLIEKYDKTSLNCDFNAEEVYQQLNQTIKNKCIKILELMTAQDMNCRELSDSEIQNGLKIKLDQMSDQLMEIQALTKSLDKKFENYQKVFSEYLDVVHQYYNKYKLPFKLNFDEMICNLSMSKAQTLCIRNRYIETESMAEKYGNKETIERLREERKALESEEFRLKTELKKTENILSEYESLDKDLLKEYRQLKSELDCRLWALNELNQSSGSASNGSLNGLSD